MLSSRVSIITANVFIDLATLSTVASSRAYSDFWMSQLDSPEKAWLPNALSASSLENQVTLRRLGLLVIPHHHSFWSFSPALPLPYHQARPAAGVNQQNSRWRTEILVPAPSRFSASVVTDILPFSFLLVFLFFSHLLETDWGHTSEYLSWSSKERQLRRKSIKQKHKPSPSDLLICVCRWWYGHGYFSWHILS